MFGFLLKTIIICGVIGSVVGIIYLRRGSLPTIADAQVFLNQFKDSAKNVDTTVLAKNFSDTLDSLVTHPDRNSPVVLGVKITNDSLGKLVDVIQTLPPDQVAQVKQVICK